VEACRSHGFVAQLAERGFEAPGRRRFDSSRNHMKRWEKRVSGEQAREALKDILNVLGPACSDNACAGCAEEMAEAIAIAKRGLRRPPPPPRLGQAARSPKAGVRGSIPRTGTQVDS
jgi:hypothetical protein